MIDWTRITELEQDLGPEEIPGLVSAFLSEVDDVVTNLRSHPPDEAALHFLKGSAVTLGFQDLASLADAGERALKTTPTAKIDVTPLCTAYQAERAELLAKIPLPEP